MSFCVKRLKVIGVKNGFNPKNYPGNGVSLGDEIAAGAYKFHYQNGMQQFEMPDHILERLIKAKIVEKHSLPMGVEYLVPSDKIDLFNRFLNLPGNYIP